MIAESHIDQGDIGADGRILIIPGLQVLDYFCCFFLPSRNGVNMGETGVEGSTVSGKLDRSLKLCDCLIVYVLLHERLAQFIMADGKVRVHLQGFLTLLHCFVIKVSDAQCIGQICADDQGKRIKAFCLS